VGERGRRAEPASTSDDLTKPLEYMRRNARRIALNLKHPDGQTVLQRLVSRADVLVESYRPGVAERLGLGYAELSAQNPRLIYCSISGYGQQGPYRDRQGHDINYLALGGLLTLTGQPDGPPILPGTLVADLAGGGLPAAVAILGALLGRERTNEGRFIDVSLQEGVVGLLTPMIALALAGWTTGRGSSVLSGGAPWYRTFPTSDERYVAVGAIEPWLYAELCRRLDHPEWLGQQYDQSVWPEMAAEMARIFARKPLQHWRESLEDAGVCVTGVLQLDEVFDDPQLARRGSFGGGEPQAINVRALPLMSGMASTTPRPPSRPGADAGEILGELGFSAVERQRLRTSGGVG
ncbi:MAG TPA: CaiB/BaiF CoA-transferase family protein, partial [Thermomicrobiales bacterium]|nr:CaiB/BaiF CoA-transferase family protein [Thermomicrobiales bacterium]